MTELRDKTEIIVTDDEHILNSGEKETIANEFMHFSKNNNAQKDQNDHLLVNTLKLKGNIQV